VVREWLEIPTRIEDAIPGLPVRALDLRGGSEGWSIREYVHHLVEANLVASNIVLAALATNGKIRYDWSWVWPSAAWMQRVGYTTAAIRPALALLRALGRHFAALLRGGEDALARSVRLLDAPGAVPYRRTVRRVLAEEVQHANKHLRDIAKARAAHRAGRSGRRSAR
jgi:hypothetical protein